jgi:hypothetical protein
MKRFSLKRRYLLSTVAGLGAGALSYSTFVKVRQDDAELESEAVLSWIIDTILPADEFLGALDLGLDKQLFKWMQTNEKWSERFIELTYSVDDISAKDHMSEFIRLSVDERENLLITILADGADTSRLSLARLRAMIINWYYTSDQGHATLNYTLPAHYPTYSMAKLA